MKYQVNLLENSVSSPIDAIVRTYRIYGQDGHRQRESFSESYSLDVTKYRDYFCTLEVRNSDKTGTNEYTELVICADTIENIERELDGQLSDGIFENSRVGKVELVKMFTACNVM